MENTRILVAFIDEKQRLRRAEEGTIEYFRECAASVGIPPENIHGPTDLVAQFSCAGNRDFVLALDEILYDEITPGFSHQRFGVGIHSTVEDLEDDLREKVASGFSARLVAGFCWPWSDPASDGSLIPDVAIGRWSRAWNRKALRNHSAEDHPYTKWAQAKERQLDEVGCIYSAQGFEFDHVGVIWGNDLVWRSGHWVAQPAHSHDSEMRSRGKPIDTTIALPLLKNAYRVLCSRALRGCSIVCLDQETGEHLRQSLGPPQKANICGAP